MRSAIALTVLAFAGQATAQSTIYGINTRGADAYTTTTTDFVNSFVSLGPNPETLFALDLDADGTTLWGIESTNYQYGTVDLVGGAFVPLGPSSFTAGTVTGLTASIDGVTWYVSHYDTTSGRTFLYVGDATTGVFTQVGFTHAGVMIDIAISGTGVLYGHSITTDSLYTINTATGAGTLVGPTGFDATFAQGMDFDWSDGTLYAAMYASGGVGQFATLDLTTGLATALEDTTPTDGEFEMAVVSSAPDTGFAYCFGDGSGTFCPCGNSGGAGEGCANSTGSGAVLEGIGGTSVGGDTLSFQAGQLLPGQPALLFAGLNQTNGGDGVVFGDGLRCAGGGVVRLGIRIPDANGDASWGPGLAAQGGWSGGDVRRFQVWYRNPVGSPCGQAFNLSQGFEVTFTP